MCVPFITGDSYRLVVPFACDAMQHQTFHFFSPFESTIVSLYTWRFSYLYIFYLAFPPNNCRYSSYNLYPFVCKKSKALAEKTFAYLRARFTWSGKDREGAGGEVRDPTNAICAVHTPCGCAMKNDKLKITKQFFLKLRVLSDYIGPVGLRRNSSVLRIFRCSFLFLSLVPPLPYKFYSRPTTPFIYI